MWLCFSCVVVPSQVYALVGSENKGQVLGGMVAAGAGRFAVSSFTPDRLSKSKIDIFLKKFNKLCKIEKQTAPQ